MRRTLAKASAGVAAVALAAGAGAATYALLADGSTAGADVTVASGSPMPR